MPDAIKHYFATVTPEQLAADLKAAEFEKYNGVGSVVCSRATDGAGADALRAEVSALRAEHRLLRATLQGIINGCVHPDKAVRAVMVNLGPIREALASTRDLPLA